MKLSGFAALAICLALLSGCGLFADSLSNATTTAGSKPIQIRYDQIDLIAVLDQKYPQNASEYQNLDDAQRNALALRHYHEAESALTDEQKKARRDQVQERLLGASNQLCSQYRAYLQSVNNNGNFAFGSLATMAGAAGALVTGGASQALAGAAAVFSAERAEFNQDYFSNLTVAAIWTGIDARRHDVYDAIARNGQSKNVTVYPIEAAIKDAIYYHGECSLVAGVEKATDSIKQVENPGLDTLNKALIKASVTNAIVRTMAKGDAVTSDMLKADTPTTFGTRAPETTGVLAGTPLNNNGLPIESADALAATSQLMAQLGSEASTAITKVAALKHLSAKKRGDGAGTPVSAIQARAKAAIDQVNACHDKAEAAASSLATSVIAAQKASPAQQDATSHAVQSAQLANASVVSQMSIAVDWLSMDLNSGVAKLSDLDSKADAAAGSIADTDVDAASQLFAANSAQVLTCK